MTNSNSTAIATKPTVLPGDVVTLTDERVTVTVSAVLPEGVAGLDSRGQWRAIRWPRIRVAS